MFCHLHFLSFFLFFIRHCCKVLLCELFIIYYFIFYILFFIFYVSKQTFFPQSDSATQMSCFVLFYFINIFIFFYFDILQTDLLAVRWQCYPLFYLYFIYFFIFQADILAAKWQCYPMNCFVLFYLIIIIYDILQIDLLAVRWQCLPVISFNWISFHFMIFFIILFSKQTFLLLSDSVILLPLFFYYTFFITLILSQYLDELKLFCCLTLCICFAGFNFLWYNHTMPEGAGRNSQKKNSNQGQMPLTQLISMFGNLSIMM